MGMTSPAKIINSRLKFTPFSKSSAAIFAMTEGTQNIKFISFFSKYSTTLIGNVKSSCGIKNSVEPVFSVR